MSEEINHNQRNDRLHLFSWKKRVLSGAKKDYQCHLPRHEYSQRDSRSRAVIGVTTEYRGGAIQLFGEHDLRQLMRKRQTAER